MPAQGRWSTFRFSSSLSQHFSKINFRPVNRRFTIKKQMMKKLSLAICYIFMSVLVFAQQQFQGKVTDAANGAPIPGATVEFENSGTTVSGQNGLFSISLPPRSYVVTVTSIGYRKLAT